MSRNARAITTIAAAGISILLLAVFWTLAQAYTPFANSYPDKGQQAVSAVSTVGGEKQVTVNLSIQQTTNNGPHGSWLGYQLQPPAALDPSPGSSSAALTKYQFGAAIFTVPAHALVHMIIHNYDSQTALRNPYFAQVAGTIGNVAYCNANGVSGMSPTCGAGAASPFQVMPLNLTSHTFTIPDLGVSVPIAGISGTSGFITMEFTFRAPGKGTFRWQCIVPCGWGLYGFGGPMSQFGYMNGLLHFV